MKKDTPLYQLFVSKKDRSNIEWPEPEEELNLKGEGRAAQQEYLQWAWVKQWDKKLKDNNEISLTDALNNYPTRKDLLEQVQKSIEELPDNIKELKSDDFKGVKKTVNTIYDKISEASNLSSTD